MSIVQISKIQQRSGNIVDLPQLDEAELGWATDAKQLYIGKVSPNENVEVLTSYSNISFSQIDGAIGNLDMSSPATGEVLAYTGTNWVNSGGAAGGLITLGNISNVQITGGGIGYVLETDGTGNLSWTPKGTLTSSIQNITQASPAVVTTVDNNFFVDSTKLTITNVPGMTQVNGNTYYADVLTANTFALYTDVTLTTPVNSGAYTKFPFTTVTATTTGTNYITVGSSTSFTAGIPIKFLGTVFGGLDIANTYYVRNVANATAFTVSSTSNLAANFALSTASGTANVYGINGRAVSSLSSSAAAAAGGANTQLQFNNTGILDGNANLTFNYITSTMVLTGSGNVTGNVNVTSNVAASRLISNIATGTSPLVVTSTTRVSNLNVAYSNVSDFNVVTTQTTGTWYPTLVNANTTANYALGSNANLVFNAATGALAATLLTGTLTTAAQPNITSVGTLTALGVNGTITAVNITANTGVITGNGSGLSALNASNVSTGTLAQARLANSNVILGSTTLVLGTTTTSVSGMTSINSTTFTGSHANGTSNVNIPAINGNVNASVGGVANVLVITTTGANITGTANISGNLAAGNVSGTLLTGTLTTAAQPNVTSVGTLTSLAVTGNISGGNIISTQNYIHSVVTGLTATGTVQANALAITKDFNVVSTAASGTGVVFPTAVAGMRLVVVNNGANPLTVYPAVGGTMNSLAINVGFLMPTTTRLDFIATSTTQWYTLNAVYA